VRPAPPGTERRSSGDFCDQGRVVTAGSPVNPPQDRPHARAILAVSVLCHRSHRPAMLAAGTLERARTRPSPGHRNRMRPRRPRWSRHSRRRRKNLGAPLLGGQSGRGNRGQLPIRCFRSNQAFRHGERTGSQLQERGLGMRAGTGGARRNLLLLPYRGVEAAAASTRMTFIEIPFEQDVLALTEIQLACPCTSLKRHRVRSTFHIPVRSRSAFVPCLISKPRICCLHYRVVEPAFQTPESRCLQ
jgi:hypothetical protein